MFQIVLILCVLAGGATGHFWPESTRYLKPFGDIFLNLVFSVIVPLVFFSVSSAIAQAGSFKKLGRIFGVMGFVFVSCSIIAAILTIIVVQIFPPASGVYLNLGPAEAVSSPNLSQQLTEILTVSDFSKLLSHEHMFALIIFSILVGLSASSTAFSGFLKSGEEVFMRVFSLIMYYAPIGFFAYFAVLVSELGPQLVQNYVRVTAIYYVFGILYFLMAYSAYAYLAARKEGVKIFWKNIALPMTTSLATCSSAASIPANLTAAKAMGVSAEIYETAVPLGAILHKQGSVIGGVVKIAFLFGIYHMDFTGLSVWMMALGVSLLVGTVMGAIPSGGMLGELLILSVYGFPPSALMAIAAISIIIDPLATMLSVTGNTVASMLIARGVRLTSIA